MYAPKRAGHCVRCGVECYEIRRVFPENHPRAGDPLALGPQHPHGCQVLFILDDESETAVTLCRDCAVDLTEAEYPVLWQACQDAEAALGGASLRERRIVSLAGFRKEAKNYQGAMTALEPFEPIGESHSG